MLPVKSGRLDGYAGVAGPVVTVYVDAAIWPYGRMIMCHLFADTTDELHAMVDKIGVQRKWFQSKKWPHYDIAKSKRKLAVAHGAVEVDRKRFIEIADRLQIEWQARGIA